MSSLQTAHSLPPDHFLLQPRQDYLIGTYEGHVDTSTLAAHDFDVDTRTGFMPPDPPLSRLPGQWELWEMTLEVAMQEKLQLAVKPGLTVEDEKKSQSWRHRVKQVSTGLRWILLLVHVLTRTISCRSYPRLN